MILFFYTYELEIVISEHESQKLWLSLKLTICYLGSDKDSTEINNYSHLGA